MTISPDSDKSGFAAPTVPDVTGLSLLDAVCAYAEAGLYVLPVAYGKHPGSIVGRGWPRKSSRDPEGIRQWWTRYPNAGIAIHTGRSKLVAVDLDVNDLAGELTWLKNGLFQSSRGIGARGHYVFASAEIFVCGDLKLKDGTKFGDIKSGNSVIMAQPSPHANGGEYRWHTPGVVPPLPAEACDWLTPIGTARARWAGVEATDALVVQALSEWTGDDRPKALDGPVNSIRNHTSGTGTWKLTRNALRFTASEARIGFYPLCEAVEEIRSAMIESYEKRGEPEKFNEYEFQRLIKNGVGYALSRSERDILAEADRDFGFSLYPAIPSLVPSIVPSIFDRSFQP
jgi:hypothetical protein